MDLFFVLSGYLIGGQLLRSLATAKPISISEFYIKRFFRIIPAYLVVVTLYFALPALHFYLVFPMLVLLLSVWRTRGAALWIAAAVFLGGMAIRALYLTHKITIHIAQAMLTDRQIDVQGALAFLICIAVSLAAAWVLHVAVERPFMNLRSVVLAKRRFRQSDPQAS